MSDVTNRLTRLPFLIATLESKQPAGVPNAEAVATQFSVIIIMISMHFFDSRIKQASNDSRIKQAGGSGYDGVNFAPLTDPVRLSCVDLQVAGWRSQWTQRYGAVTETHRRPDHRDIGAQAHQYLRKERQASRSVR